ncbi:MAG: hypothetical protein K9W46_00135 [Candidatus Heimdallarchaeum endolithica]|uniref:Uncharacterized protein n=1 Tax=Candidatus Heimdallarchaeum endolithica TaxID=2876572 RepID=A0A9Y1BRA7_9ARCH|nr:MAG: hypothetical protein K9W46_00135 [Candidatus Heimdallarchaeum endolithica]
MEGKVKLSINISFEDDEVDSLKRSYSKSREFHYQEDLFTEIQELYTILKKRIESDLPEIKNRQSSLDQHFLVEGEKIE